MWVLVRDLWQGIAFGECAVLRTLVWDRRGDGFCRRPWCLRYASHAHFCVSGAVLWSALAAPRRVFRAAHLCCDLIALGRGVSGSLLCARSLVVWE